MRKYLVFLFFIVYLPVVGSTPVTVGVENASYTRPTTKYFNWNTNLKISVPVSLYLDDPGIVDDVLDGRHAYYIVVKGWTDDPICKLPPLDKWDDYAAIVQTIINQYHPEVVGIWNEPDASSTEYALHLGCIGDGGEYGRFVRYIYDRTEGAQIAAGEVSNIYSDFVPDMLDALDGHYDILSFHCYEHYYGRLTTWCDDHYAKADSLTDKPVMLSETSVIYKYGTIEGYEQAQVKHFNRLRTMIPTPWFWYSLSYNGWPTDVNCDMIGKDGPRPVWYWYMVEGGA